MNGVSPFGDLSYQNGWAGTYSYPFFERDVTVKLFVPCGEGDDIEAAQRAALTHFDAAKPRLLLEAQHAIHRYYRGIVDEYRGRLGGTLAATRAPVLSNPDDLQALVTPTELIVQQSFDTGQRVIGLPFDCAWEPSLGLAVKFVNETLDAVGTQDIVL